MLAREKSLAEQFLVLLDDFGRKDVERYARGVTLYAEAKAEFDGLISALEHTLDQAQPPDQSAAFQSALNAAVDKRVAFTDFVRNTVLPQSGATTKGIGGFIAVIPDLIKALTDAGISIWREYRSAGEARRKEMLEELEALRWPAFKPRQD
ncbi:MAG TPA: hypothetical protein VEI03_12375 [Stellaceae bacterium]|nr:hypothetical protein [Stellaceae bacterium]